MKLPARFAARFEAAAKEMAERKGPIAIVEMRGIIRDAGMSRKTPFGSNVINFQETSQLLDKAFATKYLRAVALVINSPGESPAQSELLGNHIRSKADEKKVPVYAFVEDVAASGGYWLAAAADEIYCPETSTIGSIGVVASVMNFHELANKYGVQNIMVTAGDNKGKLNPFQPIDAKDIEWLQTRANDIHIMFKDWVTKRRGSRITADPETIFSADVWTGKQAMEMGLVDGNGSITEILKSKFGDRKLVRIRSRGGFAKALFGATMASRPTASDIADEILTRAAVRDIRFG